MKTFDNGIQSEVRDLSCEYCSRLIEELAALRRIVAEMQAKEKANHEQQN